MNNMLQIPSENSIKKALNFDRSKLPSFPQVAAKLIEMSNNETTSLTDVSKIVETDPAISVRVLQIVNSAMFGLRNKVTALSEAVVFLGLDEIKKLSIGMTVFEKMFKSKKIKAFDRTFFWRHCLSVAVLSMEIAKKINYPNPEEAYISGLLHDIGKIFFDVQGKKSYSKFIQVAADSEDQMVVKERELLGLGHDEVGGFYCSAWELPESLILSIMYHHKSFEHLNLPPEKALLISIVSLANFLCWTQGIGSYEQVRPPVIPPEVEKYIDLGKIDIIECINLMNEEIESISEFYNFVFPSTHQIQENLLRTNLKLGRVNTKYYYHDNPLAKIDEVPEAKMSNIASDLILDLGKSLSKANTIKEVLDIVMYQVGRIFNPLHWSLLLKDPKTGNMIFTVVVGQNKKKLQGIKLPKGEGIAGHILGSGESLIIDDVSKDKRFSKRVDKYTGFETQSIIGIPLKTDRKIFGVIELINKITGDTFTQSDLKILSSIGEYAAIAIERSYYNQALTRMASIDSFTGLKNKWAFEKTVSNQIEMQNKYGSVSSMIVVDIDRKGIQDHSESDRAIKQFSLVIKEIMIHSDDIFYHGEDKFIILLSKINQEGINTEKQKILHAFNMVNMKKDDTAMQISILVHSVKTGNSKKLLSLINEKKAHNLAGKKAAPKKVLKEKKINIPEKKTAVAYEAKPKTTIKKEEFDTFGTIPEISFEEDNIDDFEEHLQPLIEQESIEEKIIEEEYRKDVSLPGQFVQLKTKMSGHITISNISMTAVGFLSSLSHRIKTNDFLDIEFKLDDKRRSTIKRRVVIRSVESNLVDAEFYNPPPYDKHLGFYMMK